MIIFAWFIGSLCGLFLMWMLNSCGECKNYPKLMSKLVSDIDSLKQEYKLVEAELDHYQRKATEAEALTCRLDEIIQTREDEIDNFNKGTQCLLDEIKKLTEENKDFKMQLRDMKSRADESDSLRKQLWLARHKGPDQFTSEQYDGVVTASVPLSIHTTGPVHAQPFIETVSEIKAENEVLRNKVYELLKQLIDYKKKDIKNE
jgi:predicted  nucleic acid-binding Zn-ribbon protein